MNQKMGDSTYALRLLGKGQVRAAFIMKGSMKSSREGVSK
jgi:hypothetical protein